MKLESRDGAFRVRAGRDTKNLLGVECYVWNTLLWSFTQEAEIYERMVWLLKLTFPGQPEKTDIDREEFQLCLRRLLTRGLVACREAETMEGAAEFCPGIPEKPAGEGTPTVIKGYPKRRGNRLFS